MIVDLFAGAGGLDVAARVLDIPSIGIEWDPNPCATRLCAGLETIQGDVRDYGPRDFPHADVLAAGPPCQTFAVAGRGSGRKALDDVLYFIDRMVRGHAVNDELTRLGDERTALILEPLRWILEAPVPYQAVVLEQVPTVLPVWAAYADVLSRDYSVDYGVLNTEAYGVPQTRKRAVLIARLGPAPIYLPQPTHQTYRRPDPGLRRWVSMGEALDRPPGYTVVSNYGTNGNSNNRGRRLYTEPAFTVTGKISRNKVLDPNGRELPRFSYAEAGILQTFPSDYPWSGKDVGQQIGNAMPPRLGAHVIASILRTEK